MIIGISINEAIDWTQDRFQTTRPLAERTLFSLMESHSVNETKDGFLLLEAEEEEADRHFRKVKNHLSQRRQPKRHTVRMTHMKHLDNSSAAEDMLAADQKDKSST